MTTTLRIDSDLSNAARRPAGSGRRHKVPVCQGTGLARYRDRHQARHGADALTAGAGTPKVSTFACPDCRGFHLEDLHAHQPIDAWPTPETAEAPTSPVDSRKRRYVLLDIENLTRGARATPEQVAALWGAIREQAPGIAARDHVVVGAARAVVRKYRAAIHGANVKWVVGADAPDGADHALLAAIDLRRVARDFDELVIVSGDHTFAALARRAKSRGLTVHVLTTEQPGPRAALSRKLAAAADTRSLVQPRTRTLTRDTVTKIQAVARASRRNADLETIAA